MKILKLNLNVLIFLCTFSVTALADSPEQVGSPKQQSERDTGPLKMMSGDTTWYNVLKEAFETAGTVSKEEVVGWMSGRCFPADNPYRAENSLLVATEVRYHSGGPALEGEHHFAMWWASNQGVTYFDYMSQREIISTRNSLNWIFSNAQNPSQQFDGSLMITYSSNYRMDGRHKNVLNTEYMLRKGSVAGSKKHYLIARITHGEGSGKFCYQFERLRDEY